MRPQHNNNNNKNRNRNRNRRHSGNMGGGGGGPNNRVLDSNGPDVKLRGTAQTIAEKYMQMARDAASAGDPVMAESYYQHGDHYYRLWLAVQPAGQPLQFSRRLAEEELEDGEGDNEGDDDAQGEGETQAEQADSQAPAEAGTESVDANGDSQQRPFRQRDNRDGQRDGQRPRNNRWPRRNERYDNAGGNQVVEGQTEQGEREERPRPAPTEASDRGGERGDWEAPSFLKRPMPVTDEAPAEDGGTPEARRPRAKRPRLGADQAPEAVTPLPSDD